MNASDCTTAGRPTPPMENEGAALDDAIDRALRDSFPASDAPSATGIVRIGGPACDAARAAESR